MAFTGSRLPWDRAAPYTAQLEAVQFDATIPAYVDPRPFMETIRTASQTAPSVSTPSFAARLVEGVVVAVIVAFILREL